MEKEVKSEADIEYEQQCPVEKYAIAKGGEYLEDGDGKVTYADGTPTPEFDKHAQIYLENILDKSHPLWQAGARYQATYAYVLSPLNDEIRLVPSSHSAGNEFCLFINSLARAAAYRHICYGVISTRKRLRNGIHPYAAFRLFLFLLLSNFLFI
jgi:hypothetical protein